VAVGEIVAVQSVIFLEMADDGLDGGAASHLSFDLWGHPSLLFGCIDFELVIWRRVVAAVSGIGVEPFDRIADEYRSSGPALMLKLDLPWTHAVSRGQAQRLAKIG
jgi:hypothetical protein